MTYQWNRLAKQFHATENLSAKQEAITQFMRFVAAAMESRAGGPGMDPVRRGLLLSKLASLVGMSVNEVQATLKRLVQMPDRVPRQLQQDTTPQTTPASPGPWNGWQRITPNTDSSNIARLDVWQLKGLDAAEAWLLGALLAQPPLYDSLREELSLTLFSTFQNLANVLIEYFDNHPDLAACTLAELSSTIDDPELLRQAIELEKKTADWLDPSQFSPAQVTHAQTKHR